MRGNRFRPWWLVGTAIIGVVIGTAAPAVTTSASPVLMVGQAQLVPGDYICSFLDWSGCTKARDFGYANVYCYRHWPNMTWNSSDVWAYGDVNVAGEVKRDQYIAKGQVGNVPGLPDCTQSLQPRKS